MNGEYDFKPYEEVLENIDAEIERALLGEEITEYERKFVKVKMKAMVGASKFPERFNRWSSRVFDANARSILGTCREWVADGYTPDVSHADEEE